MSQPGDRFYVPIEKRYVLIEHLVTLNGVPARVSGVNNDFATVRMIDSGLGAEFAWSTVERIVAKGGEFRV